MATHRPLAALYLLLALACSNGPDSSQAGDAVGEASPDAPAAVSDDAGAEAEGPVPFTEADLDAYARGRANEIEQVLAARERGRTATTPEERSAATQAEWEDATMPGAAQAAGMDEARYRRLRETVDHALETLDFQGKIDGPMEVNMQAAGDALKARLQEDPYAALTPASAAALRARLPRLTELWSEYRTLTAVGG